MPIDEEILDQTTKKDNFGGSWGGAFLGDFKGTFPGLSPRLADFADQTISVLGSSEEAATAYSI